MITKDVVSVLTKKRAKVKPPDKTWFTYGAALVELRHLYDNPEDLARAAQMLVEARTVANALNKSRKCPSRTK